MLDQVVRNQGDHVEIEHGADAIEVAVSPSRFQVERSNGLDVRNDRILGKSVSYPASDLLALLLGQARLRCVRVGHERHANAKGDPDLGNLVARCTRLVAIWVEKAQQRGDLPLLVAAL